MIISYVKVILFLSRDLLDYIKSFTFFVCEADLEIISNAVCGLGWGDEGMSVRRDVEMPQTIGHMVYFHFSIMVLAITMKHPVNWVTSLCTLSMLLTETYVVTCILSFGLHKIKRHFYDFTLETNLLDSGYNIKSRWNSFGPSSSCSWAQAVL